MKRLMWLGAALVALFGLAGVASAGPPAPHQAITEYKGPETCAMCHPDAAQEVVESVHYQMQAEAPFRVGWEEGKLGGMYVTY